MRRILSILNNMVDAGDIRDLDVSVNYQRMETSVSFVVGYAEFLPDEPFMMWVFPFAEKFEVTHAGNGKCEARVTLVFEDVPESRTN